MMLLLRFRKAPRVNMAGAQKLPPNEASALGEAELRSRRLSAGCRTMRINARADAPWLRSIELSLDVSSERQQGEQEELGI